jgi:hypothetical protein
VPKLEDALKRVRDNQVKNLADDELLKTFTSVVPGAAPEDCRTRALTLTPQAAPACVRSRGLVLNASPEPARDDAKASVVVRNDPGDDTIVKVFPFEHVTAEDYQRARAAYEAPTPDGVKKRGILMEE